jgi:SAM-dependent methyltransferase
MYLIDRAQRSLVDASVWKDPPPDDAIDCAPARVADGLDPTLAPLLGEVAWHSLTLDPRLAEVSQEHFDVVARVIADAGLQPRDARILEVAAYAHTTGYMLQRLGPIVDLFDISPSTLRLGRRLARERGLPVDGTTCVAGDFHDLPYADEAFDFVYICSALHHTWQWQRVLDEMLRVLAPGGVLLLENEPCRRRFCHYGFRANRSDAHGALEKALDKAGILRTVAEPFPGTRPEKLFGMVENQTIPVEALCGKLAHRCVPLVVTADYCACVAELEREMVARRRDPEAGTRWLVAEMSRHIEAVAGAMSAEDRGMGFGLPSHAEIEALCEEAMEALAKLPSDEQSPDFRMGLAELFGASVRIVVRKRAARRSAAPGRLLRDYPEWDDVVHAFPPQLARLLDARSAMLPDLQSASKIAIESVFPAEDWSLSTSVEGVRALLPAATRPALRVPVKEPGRLLILLRCYVQVDDKPFRFMLCAGEKELAAFDAWRSDSFLLTAIVQCPDAAPLHLSVSTRALDGANDAARVYTVSYAGAFAL